MSVPKAPPTPAQIAARLTRGQRSTLRYMTPTACVLGCAEATARNLVRGGPLRPALTYEQQGLEWKEYGLLPLGVQVQAALAELEVVTELNAVGA